MSAVLQETEADFASWVLDLARLHGWRIAHFRPARTLRGWRTAGQGDIGGWPDFILCRPPRLLAVELKSARGRMGPGQQRWLDDLGACGAEAHMWRPGDRTRIMDILSRTNKGD